MQVYDEEIKDILVGNVFDYIIQHHRGLYVFDCLILFVCAVGFGLFTELNHNWPSLSFHLWQWLPLLFGFIMAILLGMIYAARIAWEYHNGFGWFGALAAPFALIGGGYVLGLNIL